MLNLKTQNIKEDLEMYSLTITAKRKNGKRHIVTKSTRIDYLKELAKNLNHTRYVVEIFNSRWQLVETV